jgi:gamma-glutamyltranspeptidase/glutathione hydrolase
VQALVYHFDLNMDPADTLAAKRIHHQWSPNTLYVESGFAPDIAERLGELGHGITVSGTGVVQAIGQTADSQWIGVHDPRVRGKAAHR